MTRSPLSPEAQERERETVRKWNRSPDGRRRRVAIMRVWRLGHPEEYMLVRARVRAKKRGQEFSLTRADIVIPERCPVLGILLERGVGLACAGSPSLDRIDNAKGYVPGNVIVISNRANSLKSDASVEELRAVADFYGRLGA